LDALLNVKDAAALLGVSARFVNRLASTGELASVRIGRRMLFRQSDLEAFVESRVMQAA
jgi:excisionase family DNA binding protein